MLSAADAARIRRRLLRWYDRHRRDLPWRRRAGDPYAQWVAEIMLQQTRVDTVLHYYERFMRRYADLASLARADHEELLKYWEGLGYYRRLDHLHRAAQLIHQRVDGVPGTAVALRKLPGVGEYTAAAIASIAFGERVAAVDGNVARVIARLFGVREDVLTSVGKSRVNALASRLVPTVRPGDFNQAWMDLGSTICTPRSPDCPACPLASDCVAHHSGSTKSLPVREGNDKKKPKDVCMTAALFLCRGKMLVRRRPKGGLWSGLWEFPNVELNGTSHAWRAVRRLARESGVELRERLRRVCSIRHQLTHRSLTFHVYVVAVRANGPVTDGVPLRWVDPQGFRRLAVSTAHRRILQAARATLKSRLE